MGLNPRGRGRGHGPVRGRGGKGSFQNKGRRVMPGQGPMFRPGPPGMFCPPPMGYPAEPPFGGPFFGGPSGFGFNSPRPGFGNFPRKNFRRKPLQKNNDQPVPEIDLTKPWVTEEIKNEDSKKQQLLETWRKTKNDEDWSKYKTQKLTVQGIYNKAKEEYLASHPEEASFWMTADTPRKFYCETCDKSFRTDDDLILHEEEHETCGRDGCTFTAHPKIISKHIKMQHDSGLFSRIGKLYTDEDIAKWIEERKKRYPSRKVIEEKKALEQEKINRGERIKEDNSRFNKSFQNKKKSKIFEKKSLRSSKNRRRKKNSSKVLEEIFEEETQKVRRGVPAFVGLKKLFGPEDVVEENKNEFNISDDEWEINHINTVSEPFAKPVLSNSLGLLAANYDSDEDDVVDDAKKDAALSDEDSAPEEVKTIRSTNSVTEENDSTKQSIVRKNLPKKRYSANENKPETNSFQHRSVTLLEKLLKNEIRHERNVILQCVHYVVKNNFFIK